MCPLLTQPAFHEGGGQGDIARNNTAEDNLPPCLAQCMSHVARNSILHIVSSFQTLVLVSQGRPKALVDREEMGSEM